MNTPKAGASSTPSTSEQHKKLPVHPSLEHLQKQAKRRVKQAPSLQLVEAQHQIAREYGCKNWAELARVVEQRRNQINEEHTGYLKEAMLKEDLQNTARLLEDHPQLLTPALWPTAIYQAKSLAITRLLLDRGLNPNECSAPRKPLHLAVSHGLIDIVKLLLAHEASPDVVDGENITPIELAGGAISGEQTPRANEIIPLLRAAGATVTPFTQMLLREDAAVIAVIESDQDFLKKQGWQHFPPLTAAARAARPNVVKKLLAAGAEVDGTNAATSTNTPLWFACQSGADAGDRLDVARILLAAGANPSRSCEDDSTPLHFAAWRGPSAMVELLLAHGAYTWNADKHGKTALDYARESTVSRDRDEIVSLLSDVRMLDPIFRDAVDSIDQGNVEKLGDLLHSHPELLHQRAEEEGWFAGKYFTRPTLLHFVANNPYRHETMSPRILESCATILNAGAEVDAVTEGSDPHTTLALVASCEPARKANLQIPLIELLVRHGADPSKGLNAALVHFEMAAVEALLRLGANHTLLSAAACGELAELQRKLANGPTKEQCLLAAHAAAQHGRIECVELLLASGIGVNDRIPHPYSVTLLHDAAQHGHELLARRLLELGADPTLRDKQFNGTPADWAEHNGHPKLAAWLMKEETRCRLIPTPTDAGSES